jgi:hypothetical protein
MKGHAPCLNGDGDSALMGASSCGEVPAISSSWSSPCPCESATELRRQQHQSRVRLRRRLVERVSLAAAKGSGGARPLNRLSISITKLDLISLNRLLDRLEP